MIRAPASLVVRMICRALSGVIQVFALYVLFHGHHRPGGAFQGGALLAASLILLRLSEGYPSSQQEFRSRFGILLGASGLMGFLLLGIATILSGGAFLDYAALPGGEAHPAETRSKAILVAEIGLGIAIMGALVSVFDDLVWEKKDV